MVLHPARLASVGEREVMRLRSRTGGLGAVGHRLGLSGLFRRAGMGPVSDWLVVRVGFVCLRGEVHGLSLRGGRHLDLEITQ